MSCLGLAELDPGTKNLEPGNGPYVMIKSIDHIVLTASDIKRTAAFYCDALGMELRQFTPPDGSADRLTLVFGQQKINLHDAAAPFTPHARIPTAGALDLCFLSDVGLADWIAHLAAHGIAIEQGPIRRTGATGPINSIYVRDPDGNLVEIANPV